MNDIELKTIAIDGKARLNEVTVNGKQFQTPLFMPVATRGALKSLPFNYLEHTDIILANTYHLFLRPGLDVIQKFDGLHKFIGWNKVILTDSGGFQGWSIPNRFNDDGIEFKNIYDGSKFFMDPKLSMDIQQTLNSDIAMILDSLIDINKEYDQQLNAINTTQQWANIARNYHTNNNQSLFGIVQGGKHKELREKSGAGIVDCKNALLQNKNNIDKSIDWLRKKGLSVAAKKSGRVAAEGLVGVHIDNNQACLIEINSETDFVSRNEQFQKFVNDCSKIATTTDGDLDNFLKSKFIESDNTVEDELTKNIATIGENLNVRMIEKITLDGPGSIVSYVHNSAQVRLKKGCFFKSRILI